MISIPPKLAMIHDITGFGRCSAAVAIPIVSVLKVQACLIPTSIFSNHTGFPTWHFDDYTKQMPAYLEGLQKLQLIFDGIYCGFLGSVAQIELIENFIRAQQQKQLAQGHPTKPLIIVDPVMGDHGKAYHTITDAHCRKMQQLVRLASIITPNITEACLLTDTPYKEHFTEAELQILAKQLHQMGPDKIVITGIRSEDCYVNYIFCPSDTAGQISSQYHSIPHALPYDFCRMPIAGESRPGTGDIFASIIAAKAMTGGSFPQSVLTAASFVKVCTEASSQAGIPIEEGVCFENYLNMLF